MNYTDFQLSYFRGKENHIFGNFSKVTYIKNIQHLTPQASFFLIYAFSCFLQLSLSLVAIGPFYQKQLKRSKCFLLEFSIFL